MLDTLKIARDLSEGDVFSHEQAERLANALATYWNEIRSELVTKEYLDARLSQLEARFDAKFDMLEAKFDAKFDTLEAKFDAKFDTLEAKFDAKFETLEGKFDASFDTLEAKFETKLAQVQNRILASQVALFVLLGIAILLK
jgi:hypothetical protein